MRILFLSWFLWFFFIANILGIDIVLVSGQCQRDQQSLLLQMKNNLIYNSSSSVYLVQWNQNTDCCQWNGVDCDAAGRVIGLDLNNESITGITDNLTAITSLQYLRKLNLGYNRFSGIVPTQLATLTNLAYLNLSNAGFGGQIPVSISGLTNLVTLDLSIYSFAGSPSLKLENPNLTTLVRNLTALKELYLDGVNISANGKEWCQALSSSLPNLQVLSLSNCFLSGPIDPSLQNLQSLSVIRLDQNDLLSPVPDFLADFSNLTSVRLSSCRLNGTFPEKIIQVRTLQTLDLSGNELLHGFVPELPQSSSLQTLITCQTSFSRNLPESIGNLKNLLKLELANCRFTGNIPISLENLTQLVHLDLSTNNFTGTIPPLHKSTNLMHLDLSHNALTGEISSTDWNKLLNLAYVNLRNSSLGGRLPTSLFTLPSLQKLQLANNRFTGLVPEFQNASSSVLDTLDLSANNLEGHIPTSVFELQRINILVLSSNKLNGTVPLDKIQRLGNLTKLDLSYNRLVMNASKSVSSWPPQITTLRLASCSLNTMPNLNHQSKLFHLDLSENQIPGEIPNWLWQIGNGSLNYLNLSRNLLTGLEKPYHIPRLSIIDLNSNQLHGNIPPPPRTAAHVDYSKNKFTSPMPGGIGNLLKFAVFFSVSNNNLTGVIPESLCSATNLKVLDLSHNNFSGTIPTCLFERIETLGVLNLRRNNIEGNISGTFSRYCELQTLDVNGNRLQGIIPKSLANCTQMEVLDLGNNQIHDTFPCWLKNITTLRVLVLRSNNFHGSIGCPESSGTWQNLQIVDLASNNFSGNIPKNCLRTWEAMMVDEDEAQSRVKHLNFQFLGLSGLYYLDAVTVTSKGLEMELVKILTLFTSIDLSSNNFQGPIPEEIGQLRSLYVLNLSHNALTGHIPSWLGNLRQLESLDLSVNNLRGEIPSQLASLSFLSFLNVSYNNLIGRIPSGTQLQLLQPSSFAGNEGLCGFPLQNCTENSPKLQPSEPTSTYDSSASISGIHFKLEFIFVGIGFGVGAAVAFAPLMFSKKVNGWYDHHIDKFLLVMFSMVGMMYKTSLERRLEEEEVLEDKDTDDDDDDGQMGYVEFHGKYCVFCTKLDITKTRVIHDKRCTCHVSQASSFSSATSFSDSSTALK